MPFKEPPRPPQVRTIKLSATEYTPLPNSDNKVALFGPGEIKITRFVNGSVQGEVISGSTGKVFDAVQYGLKRVGW